MQGHEEAEKVRGRSRDDRSIGGGIEGRVGDQNKPFPASAPERLPILLLGPVRCKSGLALQVKDGGNVSGSG